MDDMFVILSALSKQDVNLSFDEKIGKALSHSGMAITITTITDVFAFFIGTQTVRIIHSIK